MPLTTPQPNSADVGLIGLAVMGANFALNMADHGFKVAVYNRTTSVTEAFVAENPASIIGPGGALVPAAELKDFVASIKRPRRIMILVKAGKGTDAVIDSLVPLLEAGDCIIDGGNAEWNDTSRREAAAKAKGLLFVGSGVSGGEEGARFGPSLMPGGDKAAWELIKPIWTAVAAKVNPQTGKPLVGAKPGHPIMDASAVPCTAFIGPGGAGHYVKMVHNGIEYGDMQLICEAYHFMRDVLEMGNADMAKVFANWNTGELDSFLIEITADILKQNDPITGKPFVDIVLDAAGQKGTGKWTSTSALDLGVPASTIAEAVFARCISAIKDERVAASKILAKPEMPSIHWGHEHGGQQVGSGADHWVDAVRDALYCSKICSYAQGFALMTAAGRENKWTLNFGEIAQIWRGGCIIRARFLQKITEAYQTNPALANLLLDPFFSKTIAKAQNNWRKVVARAAIAGVPVPAFASALAYYDSYRTERLPANLLQAQRDYFGSHTYERIDQPRGKFFHLDWLDPKRPQLDAAGPGH
ncbi:MAG: NADP-dependent phosphogluconate dehydrogenase [Phycisphaerales bacterium]|nr:NADP-dependent phosphogluconate dehydrogenase [Phycisphaerales bacterium]